MIGPFHCCAVSVSNTLRVVSKRISLSGTLSDHFYIERERNSRRRELEYMTMIIPSPQVLVFSIMIIIAIIEEVSAGRISTSANNSYYHRTFQNNEI